MPSSLMKKHSVFRGEKTLTKLQIERKKNMKAVLEVLLILENKSRDVEVMDRASQEAEGLSPLPLLLTVR